jgi:transposase
LYHAGFAVSVINPAQAHHFAKAQLKRAKNDVLDAQTIAQLAQALVPPCWTPPPRIYHELHQRLAQRASLLEWRTQINNQLHALSVSPEVVPTVRDRLVQLIDQLDQQAAQLDKELLELVKVEQEQPYEGEMQFEVNERHGILREEAHLLFFPVTQAQLRLPEMLVCCLIAMKSSQFATPLKNLDSLALDNQYHIC